MMIDLSGYEKKKEVEAGDPLFRWHCLSGNSTGGGGGGQEVVGDPPHMTAATGLPADDSTERDAARKM